MRRTWTLAAVLLAAGCTDDPAPTTGAPPAATAIPAEFRLAASPAGAIPVGEAKKTAKEGEEVVIRGVVGGSVDPFVQGRAMMTIVDPKAVVSCGAMGGEDHCPTPWDYCCVAQEQLLANTATIRVAGADGQPLKGDLKGWNGVAPMKIVVVKGKVGPRPQAAVLVVDAAGIFVEP